MMQHSLLTVCAGGDDLRRATTKHQVDGVGGGVGGAVRVDAAPAQQLDEGEIVVGRGRTNNEGGPFVMMLGALHGGQGQVASTGSDVEGRQRQQREHPLVGQSTPGRRSIAGGEADVDAGGVKVVEHEGNAGEVGASS